MLKSKCSRGIAPWSFSLFLFLLSIFFFPVIYVVSILCYFCFYRIYLLLFKTKICCFLMCVDDAWYNDPVGGVGCLVKHLQRHAPHYKLTIATISTRHLAATPYMPEWNHPLFPLFCTMQVGFSYKRWHSALFSSSSSFLLRFLTLFSPWWAHFHSRPRLVVGSLPSFPSLNTPLAWNGIVRFAYVHIAMGTLQGVTGFLAAAVRHCRRRAELSVV